MDMGKLAEKLAENHARILADEGKSLVVEAEDISRIAQMQEFSGAAKLMTQWKKLHGFDFDQLKNDTLAALKESGKKKYSIKTKFHDKANFSSRRVYKAMNPFLKKEGFSFDENADAVAYVEFRRQEGSMYYRVSYYTKVWSAEPSAAGIGYSRFAAVIENPRLADEVSDFLRLCWIFKIPLFIVTKEIGFEKLLKKAKDITKGIDYEKLDVKVVERMPEGYALAGFSKLAKESEKGLKSLLSKDGEKIALVFGDDKFGLTQEAREKMNFMFRLTPELKKPLRASHALSYVLGIYTSMKV